MIVKIQKLRIFATAKWSRNSKNSKNSMNALWKNGKSCLVAISQIFSNMLRIWLRSSLATVVSARAYIFEGKERRGERNDATGTFLERWRERTHPEPSFHRARRTAREIRDMWREARKEKGNQIFVLCRDTLRN